MMRMEEFKKYLESLEYIDTQIVYIKYKYSWEENWTYSNEILEVDMNADGYYVWASDWNEGQEDIEILGCIALYDIYVPKFQKDTEVNRMSDYISKQAAINAIENTDCELSPKDWDELTDAIIRIPSEELIKAYTKADYIMALHKEYGCTLTMAEEAHNKALEHLRSKARMKG